jgi:oligosaccharyltransferase complex subunit epsilon
MAPPKSTRSATQSTNAVGSLWKAYSDNTSSRLKFIDAFLVFLMLSGVMQFLYCILVTNFPFNAFLAGCVCYKLCIGDTQLKDRFSSCVGQFVLTASLRSQVNPENKDTFKEVSPERSLSRLNGAYIHLTKFLELLQISLLDLSFFISSYSTSLDERTVLE